MCGVWCGNVQAYTSVGILRLACGFFHPRFVIKEGGISKIYLGAKIKIVCLGPAIELPRVVFL